METLHDRVERRIRETICKACIYECPDGGCSLQKMACPILSRLDRIIKIVATTRSDQIDPYIDRLREVICSQCAMQDADGDCRLRRQADCALDDYFVLLVELIEQEIAEAHTAALQRK